MPGSGRSHFLGLQGRGKGNPLTLALPRCTKEKTPEGSAFPRPLPHPSPPATGPSLNLQPRAQQGWPHVEGGWVGRFPRVLRLYSVGEEGAEVEEEEEELSGSWSL